MRLIRYTTPALHTIPSAYACGLGNTLDRLFEEVSSGAATPEKTTLAPRYKVCETSDAYTLHVELPGVSKDGLELTVDQEQIRVIGRRAQTQPDSAGAATSETVSVSYELVLDHDHAIDPARISAELRDGLLRVVLPKSEALKPRKIAVA